MWIPSRAGASLKSLALSVIVLTIAATASAAASDSLNRISVLVTQQTPSGPIETAGYVSVWRLSGNLMQLDYTDAGDALFHNGFDP